ncbi:phosphate ABC transporter permease family protein, partial [Pseudomonas syringae]|uniref:phosphate ABC transporter permease family protein n=1 Tax=Pseudomonas syringae TaxID=317 RepID=UPI000AC37BA9
MIWIYLLILMALSAAAFFGGRELARRRSVGAKPHSRPGQHGAYALIWVAAPALLVLILASVFSAPLQRQLTASGAPEAVASLEPFRRDAF